MTGRKPYKWTLADLRRDCPLLAKIEVEGKDSKSERLVGRSASGEVVVQTPPGAITPKKSMLFKDLYQTAVNRGVLKPKESNGQEK